MKTLLSADIGGTKVILERSQYATGTLKSITKQTLSSAAFPCFSNMLAGFIEPNESIDAACFAIAGPIQQETGFQTAKVTNLPWTLSTDNLKESFGITNVKFINDFQAMGYAIDHLTVDDFENLQLGRPEKNGIRAVIGAGTGLGEAIIVHDGKKYDVLATEGGHQDFAANSPIEIELYRFLAHNYEHVSYERLLSGAGLINIFQFLIQHEPTHNHHTYKEILQSDDPAAAISRAANAKKGIMAQQALTLFMKIYGAKAGNLALTCLPTGGIYVTGGIAGKNLHYLKNSGFIEAFNAKGRMQPLLKKMPINVVINQEAGLVGATQYALQMVNTDE